MSSQLMSSQLLSPGGSVYAARLERVKSHHLELEAEAKEKLVTDQLFLEEKRRMGKKEQNKKATLAKDYIKAWEERNEDYAQRREKGDIRSDAEMLERMA